MGIVRDRMGKLGEYLDRVMRQKNLTPKELAKRCGLTDSYIGRVRKGTSDNLTVRIIADWAKAQAGMRSLQSVLRSSKGAVNKMPMIKPHYVFLAIVFSLASCVGTHTSPETQAGPPTILLLNGKTVGCGFFVVYKDTEDRTKLVMVTGRMDELNINNVPKTFDIENPPGLEVYLDDYGQGRHGELCQVGEPQRYLLQHIKATSGKVTVFISRDKIEGSLHPRAFGITVQLKDASFSVPNGSSYYIEAAEMNDVVVGSQSG